MDLTIDIDAYRLNIRVAVLIQTPQGFLFEKGKDGYYFVLGGRVKANESSLDAAKREIFEEISLHVENLKLVSLLENFYPKNDSAVQEICFVYHSEEILELELPSNIVSLKKEELGNCDIRPEIIKKILTEEQKGVTHFTVRR